MLRKFAAFMLAFVLALSAVSCGKQAGGDGSSSEETVSSETEKTTTKKKSSDSDSKKDTTTTKKKKKTTTKEITADKDSSKETQATKQTTAATKKTTAEDFAEIEVTEEDTLGWTKDIVEKYESASTSEEFIKSLTFEEFMIVVKSPEDTARMQYNALHGITTPRESAVPETSIETTTTYSVTVVTEDPGAKIDMTEDSELKSVYDKFGVDLNDLLAITGLSKEEFFYVWNVQKDNTFRKQILNQLYGYNYFESSSTSHPVVPNKLDMKLLRAYWDNFGRLHMICSINNGFGGLAYNIEIPNIEARDKFDRVIAKKNFGLITKYVDINDSENDEAIEGIGYDQPVLHEFVFEAGQVSKPYANIRGDGGMKITYQCRSEILN
ncbi:MAG: hypothetical protein K6B74_04250 [Ruminococcus sp.]|nr:hypothetical protein [Ruminococcus sp.]